MFKDVIRATPFSGDLAQEVFTNIKGTSSAGDVTFLSTLRALLANRIPKEDSVNLRFGATYRTEIPESISDAEMYKFLSIASDRWEVDQLREEEGQFWVVSLSGEPGTFDQKVEFLRKCLTGMSYEENQKVGLFFKESFPVASFYSADKQNVFLFAENMDVKRMHYIQIATLICMPWYYKPGTDGLSADELNLMYSLREPDSQKYVDSLDKLAERFDFRGIAIRKRLGGIEARVTEKQIRSIRSSIERVRRTMRDLLDQYNSEVGALNDLNIREAGLTSVKKEDGEESELMSRFLCDKHLYLENVSDDVIYFSVANTASYFDEDMAATMIGNSDSSVYHNLRNFSTARFKKLLKAIFVDQDIQLLVCAGYSYEIAGGVRPLRNHDFPAEIADYLPNPHIDKFTCLGNYGGIMSELSANGKCAEVIEQCAASAISLNWSDGAVMTEMGRAMSATDRKCCCLPDGRRVTPRDAAKWLEEREKDEKKKED